MTIKILLLDREVPVEHARDVFETAYSLAFLQDKFHCVVDTGFRAAEVIEELFQSVLAITSDMHADPIDDALLCFAEDNPKAILMFTSDRKPGEFRLDISLRTIDPKAEDTSPFNIDNTLCLVMQRILFYEDEPNYDAIAKI